MEKPTIQCLSFFFKFQTLGEKLSMICKVDAAQAFENTLTIHELNKRDPQFDNRYEKPLRERQCQNLETDEITS